MTATRSIFACLLFVSGAGYGEETEIHRCTQDDGTVAFQEIPCSEPVEQIVEDDESQSGNGPNAPKDEFFEFVNPFDEQEEAVTVTTSEPSAPPSQDRAECEKTTRDAIDAIDVKLRSSDNQEDDREYLAELLELTRQLRACKQL